MRGQRRRAAPLRPDWSSAVARTSALAVRDIQVTALAVAMATATAVTVSVPMAVAVTILLDRGARLQRGLLFSIRYLFCFF